MSWIRRVWSRMLTGDGLRKTRFHTYSGRLVNLGGLAYLPRSLWSVFLLKVFGFRQRRPWLSYRAVKHLNGLVQPDWSVLEFGSGMSSLFFARRCRHLVSVESDPTWHEMMLKLLASRGLNNVDYRLRSEDIYTDLPDLPDQSFDLVVIDGLVRDRCARVALSKVKPGGYVFFDNSDVPWPEHQAARQTIAEAADRDGITLFDDFYPFQVQVNESMLVRTKGYAG